MVQLNEAEMEARGVLETPRTVTVMCQTCKTRTVFEIGMGVPIAPCPVCGTKVSLRPLGRFPEVTSR